MLRFFGLAAVLTVLVAVLPAASVAANHQTFTDAVGDDSQGYAPDITAVDVAATDEGGIVFKVLINEQGGGFFVGDTLEVLLNTDDNASTGNQGAESGLFVFTNTGRLDYEFCNFNSDGTRTCSTYASGTASDVKTATNSHVVTFSNSYRNWTIISLSVVGLYTNPQNPGAGTFADNAPDHGQYVFNLNNDPDGDGITGTGERCPTYRGGKLDRDGDGCPPKLPPPAYNWAGGRVSGSVATFDRIGVTNAQSAVTVTARFVGLVSRRRGSGALPRVPRHRFPVNSRVILIYTNPNYFGSYKILRITRAGSLTTLARGCTPPGSLNLISCPKL
jgi:hypothetical protein